jgi:hypothetical protein
MEIKWIELPWRLIEAGIPDVQFAKRRAGQLFVFYKSVSVRHDKNGTFAIFARGDKSNENR